MSKSKIFTIRDHSRRPAKVVGDGVVLPTGRVVVNWFEEGDSKRVYSSYDSFLLRLDEYHSVS